MARIQDPLPHDLITWARRVDEALALRAQFQALLRPDIRGEGHRFWERRLEQYRDHLDTGIQFYFLTWDRPHKKTRKVK